MDKHHIIAILAAILFQSSQEMEIEEVVKLAYTLYDEVTEQSPHLKKKRP